MRKKSLLSSHLLALVLILFCSHLASVNAASMRRTVALATTLKFIDRVNTHDVAGLCALMTPDYLFVDAFGTTFQGREKMRMAFTTYFKLFPDYRMSYRVLIQNGSVIGLFGKAGATFSPDGRLLPGNRWEVPAAWQIVVRGNQVAEWRIYADNEPLRRLLGTIQPERG